MLRTVFFRDAMSACFLRHVAVTNSPVGVSVYSRHTLAASLDGVDVMICTFGVLFISLKLRSRVVRVMCLSVQRMLV